MKELDYYIKQALYWEGQAFLIGLKADKCRSIYDYPQLKKQEYEARQEMLKNQKIVADIKQKMRELRSLQLKAQEDDQTVSE